MITWPTQELVRIYGTIVLLQKLALPPTGQRASCSIIHIRAVGEGAPHFNWLEN